MMATRRSFAGFFNRSCVWAAMYCTETTPNRPPLGWGRNVYWRFRSLSTPSAMAVVIHRNRFCLSTFSASGTAWALEYTPARMSTFSTLSSRSASLIATSAFDWLSPSTWTILYLPSTPPRSFTRSIIILAPRQQLSEPAAENGPEWSKRTPILVVGARRPRGDHGQRGDQGQRRNDAPECHRDSLLGTSKKWGAAYHVRRANTSHSRPWRPRAERSGGSARSMRNGAAKRRRTSARETANGGPPVTPRRGKKHPSSQPPGRKIAAPGRT